MVEVRSIERVNGVWSILLIRFSLRKSFFTRKGFAETWHKQDSTGWAFIIDIINLDMVYFGFLTL